MHQQPLLAVENSRKCDDGMWEKAFMSILAPESGQAQIRPAQQVAMPLQCTHIYT